MTTTCPDAASGPRVARLVGGLVVVLLAGAGLNLWLTPPGHAQQASPRGAMLFARDCASCHGTQGQGTAFGPSLDAAGTAGVDFVLRTGRMPLVDYRRVADGWDPGALSLRPGPPAYPPAQRRAIVDHVGRVLADPAPRVPDVALERGSVSRGFRLYQRNCASCHAWSGRGGALATGAVAPDLVDSEPIEVLEAMRYGAGSMPVFSRDSLDDEQAASVARYVQELRTPETPGGHPLALLGPVSEGFVALAVGLVGLLLIARWIGRPSGS